MAERPFHTMPAFVAPHGRPGDSEYTGAILEGEPHITGPYTFIRPDDVVAKAQREAFEASASLDARPVSERSAEEILAAAKAREEAATLASEANEALSRIPKAN